MSISTMLRTDGEDRNGASTTALLEFEQPQTFHSRPCSGSDEFLSPQSTDELQNCAVVEAEAAEDRCIVYHSGDPQDAPLMPPCPSKLLRNSKSTCESRPEVYLAQLASEPDSAKAAFDAMLPSADQVEDAKTTVSSPGEEDDTQELFTVMLKNIHCHYTKEDLLDFLAGRGWRDSYNFFHLPTPKKPSKGSKGYAFIGFEDPKMTKRFMQEMKGVRLPGRKSTKILDVVPARLQGLHENLSQFANSNTLPFATCLSSKDTLPMQEAGSNVCEKQQQQKTGILNGSCEDAAVMPLYSWNPMHSGFSSLLDMWSDSLQCEESCARMAANKPHDASPNLYSLSAGFTASYGTQSVTNHSYWDPDHDNPEERLASELDSISPLIESREDPESDEDSQIQRVRESSLALLASESDTAKNAFDGMLRSAGEVEHARAHFLSPGDEELFTVMLKNIPCRCSEEDLLDFLSAHGWRDSYNFFHLPAPKKPSKGSKGYAFIGFADPNTTKRFMQEMKGVKLQLPGRKSTKVLDVVPARLQGLDQNLSQFANNDALPSESTCLSSKDTLPMQEAGAKACKKQHLTKTGIWTDSCKDAAVIPPCAWKPMPSELRSLLDLWSDSLQCEERGHAPLAHDIQESCTRLAANKPHDASPNLYSLSAGFTASYGTQSVTNHSYWDLDHDNPEERLASELDPESDKAPNVALHAAGSDDGFECAEIADEDELLAMVMRSIPFMHDVNGAGFSTSGSAKVLDIASKQYQGLHDNLANFAGKSLNQSSRAPIYSNDASSSQVMYWTESF